MKRETLTTVLSALISLGVIAYVVSKLDYQTTRSTFVNLHWGWLSLALVVFGVNYLLRTLRFRALIYTQKPPFPNLLGVISLYGMFNYLLPAKSGEVSYLVLLNRRLRISLAESATTLLAARFFDFAAIALFLPLVLFSFWQQLPRWVVYVSIVFCVLIFVIGGGMLWFLRHSAQATDQKKSYSSHRFARLHRIWGSLIMSLRLIDQHSQYIRLWLLTISIWMCVFTNFYFIVLSMGYQLSYLQMIVVSIIMIPLTLLPLQGFANLGTHEVGWVTVFTLFGQSTDVALNIAVSSHVILLSFVLVLGIFGSFLGIRLECVPLIAGESIDA